MSLEFTVVQQLIFTFETFEFQQFITHDTKIRLTAAMFGHVMMCLLLKSAERARAAGHRQAWQNIVTIEKVRAEIIRVVFTPTRMCLAHVRRFVNHFHVFFPSCMRAVR